MCLCVLYACLSPVFRYVYKEEIQVRLQFLTWVFSMVGSPEGFRKFLHLHHVFISLRNRVILCHGLSQFRVRVTDLMYHI